MGTMRGRGEEEEGVRHTIPSTFSGEEEGICISHESHLSENDKSRERKRRRMQMELRADGRRQ